MARKFTDGAETGDLSFWANSSNITVTSTTPLSGTYSYLLASAGGVRSFAALSELYFRARLKHVTGHSVWFTFRNNTSELINIEMDVANSRYNIYNNATGIRTYGEIGTVVGTNSHLVEAHYKIDNTTGIIEIKVDGIVRVSVSGDTLQGVNSTCDNFILGTSYTGYTIYLDDLALNDTTGGADNSWCGDGKVIALVPNANGDSSQWGGSDGNSTDNYALVDELPPSDTDYVEESTTGQKDSYNLSTYTLAAGESVLRVWAWARAKDTASSGTLKLGMKTHSVDYVDSVNIGTTFAAVKGPDKAVNPTSGVAWTQAELDALQITIEMP